MSKYVTDEAMRSAMTLQKGYIDKGDNTNAEGIEALRKGKNMLHKVLTGGVSHAGGWGSSVEAVQDPTLHDLEVKDGVFSIKESGDNYIVSPSVYVEAGKTYTFSFYHINGGHYEINIIGGQSGQNYYQTQGVSGGMIGPFTFTAVDTEYVRIFVRTDSKKLMFPQLELGSSYTEFTASTEELKDYIDKGDKANAEGIESIEDRMEEVVQTQLITTPPATLNAQVGYYYCMGGSGVVVDTMTIQLPAIADENKTKNVQFFMTMGSAPEVTFVSAGTERILYQKDFALEAKRSYEVNALWNGHAWVITVVDIIPMNIITYEATAKLVETTLQYSSGLHTNAFSGKSDYLTMTSHTFENGIGTIEFDGDVTNIGERAFQGCTGLTSINIPDSVTNIGERAFQGCTGLTNITIPDGVTSIGGAAFDSCTGLTSITIPNSVTSIGGSAFSQCTGLTSITIPNSVTSIEGYAFQGCRGLTSITIPNSVTSIGGYAFANCEGLTSVTIGNGITSIGGAAFGWCSGLTSITIPNSVTSIGDKVFQGCTGLTNITIPDGVTSIGYSAFDGCTGLTNITIPDGVTSIGYSAFDCCMGLTSINIPDSVTSIGDYAFQGCTGLTSINIPDSVTSIGDYAFQGCTGLTTITSLATTAPTIQSNTFIGVKTNGTLTVPSGSTGYDVWMGTGYNYLGYYNWTKVEQ